VQGITRQKRDSSVRTGGPYAVPQAHWSESLMATPTRFLSREPQRTGAAKKKVCAAGGRARMNSGDDLPAGAGMA